MEMTMQGTVHGKSIELDSEVGLPTGSRVMLHIQSVQPLSTKERLHRLLGLFDELGRDESFVKAVTEVVKRRSMPREVHLDAAP